MENDTLQRLGLILLAALLPILPAIDVQAASAKQRAEETLRRALDAMAERQVSGGWGRAWTLDGTITWGEYDPMPHTHICAQPPATPTLAQLYLDAGTFLDDPGYLERARMARDALRAILTPEGGVPYEADPKGEPPQVATFDDDVTQATLEFLIAWWQHTHDGRDLALVNRIGDFILHAQYEIGGWPQRYPPPAGYGRYITFNDGVMANNLELLLMLHRETRNGSYLMAASDAGECIIRLQGGEGEAIWAQQYDDETLEPAWARNFEPPGYSPAESIGVCNALLELYLATGEERFLEPLPKAFAWYENHRLENGKYARLYEPGTQRPVYGRRDKAEKVYDYEKACDGYAWQGEWYPHAAKALYERIQEEGREAVLAERRKPEPKPNAADLEPEVTRICEALSQDGYWLRDPADVYRSHYAEAGVSTTVPMILAEVFIENARLLLRYLAAIE